MKAQNLKRLELICKKCGSLRNEISLETFPKEYQLEIEMLEKEMRGT